MAAGGQRKKKHRSGKDRSYRYVKYGWPALGVGLVLGIMAMNSISPGRMIVSKKGVLGFEATVTAIEEAIPGFGFVHIETVDARRTLGADFRVKLIQVLHTREASAAVSMDGSIACMVPTTIAVYEDEDRNVLISYLRPSWAGKIFGPRTADMLESFVEKALPGT